MLSSRKSAQNSAEFKTTSTDVNQNSTQNDEFHFEVVNHKHAVDSRTRDLSSRSLPERARTHVEADDATRAEARSELQAIADEMRALRDKQKRKSHKRGALTKSEFPETISERQTSPGSRVSSASQSGARYDADVSHCDSDTGFSDRSDDAAVSPGIDRTNLRKISASKRRKSPAASSHHSQGDTGNGDVSSKPPAYRHRSKVDLEAERLIRTIDSID